MPDAKIYTVEDVMDWPPCPEYPEERVRELLGDGLTIGQILDLDIPVQDRVWAGIHALYALDPRRLYVLAAAAARRACEAAGWEHPDSMRAIEAAEKMGRGEEVEGIEEIRAAALRAADDVCGTSVCAANVAYAAARACAADRLATRACAYAAAYLSGERERQLDHLREMVRELRAERYERELLKRHPSLLDSMLDAARRAGMTWADLKIKEIIPGPWSSSCVTFYSYEGLPEGEEPRDLIEATKKEVRFERITGLFLGGWQEMEADHAREFQCDSIIAGLARSVESKLEKQEKETEFACEELFYRNEKASIRPENGMLRFSLSVEFVLRHGSRPPSNLGPASRSRRARMRRLGIISGPLTAYEMPEIELIENNQERKNV